MADPQRWSKHLCQVILPWWESHGVDDMGGVLTCFDNTGHLVSRDKYTWSQGRWAWLAAELADEARAGRLAVEAEVWAERARRTARFLVRYAVLPDHRTAFRVGEDNRPIPNPPDGLLATSVFADLFVVLGLAGALRYAAGAEADQWEEIALTILATAEESIAARTARTEPYPVPEGFADLAGPMNLLHASSELLRARDSRQARAVRDRARAALLCEEESFLQSGTWWEFRPAPSRGDDTLLARHRTPGHLLELVWMLLHSDDQARQRGEDVVTDLDQLARLAGRAVRIGWDDECGGLLRYVDRRGGRPRGPLLSGEPTAYEALVAETWDTKLWWVHAEAMYATALLQARGVAEMAAAAQSIEEYTMTTFPDAVHGEWLQIRRRDGNPSDMTVALPVKDPLHIARSLILLNRLANGE